MIKNFILSLFISGSLFAQSEAYDVLKVFEPFIGEWFSKHKRIGAFEGLPKDKQIDLLKARDVANEKMVNLISPKWYENTYLWLGIGFILGKL